MYYSYSNTIAKPYDVPDLAACGAACVERAGGCDVFSYSLARGTCWLGKGRGRGGWGRFTSDYYYGVCPGLGECPVQHQCRHLCPGRSPGPSKLRGLKCGGMDVCQARGVMTGRAGVV